MSNSAALKLSGIKKNYVVSNRVLEVLDAIDLEVHSGEFVSIVGTSGCGKSTLLRLVLGLDSDYQGEIFQNGRLVDGTSLSRGIVFQEHRLFPWLTVEKNVGLALQNSDLTASQKRDAIQEHIELVGLDGFEKAYPYQLSGGMSQRIAIARGLVNRPEVLLLDEPFGALDPITRANLQQELQRIWAHEKITMILVTHDVEEAVFLGDRVVVMESGPGRIKRIVPVEVPHPRDRLDPQLQHIRDDVLREFVSTSPGTTRTKSTEIVVERPPVPSVEIPPVVIPAKVFATRGLESVATW